MINSNYFLKRENGAKIFWGELSPCNHLVQIYEEDEIFLDMLAGLVTGGISSNESVIMVATQTHLNAQIFSYQTPFVDCSGSLYPLEC